jgi:hypothetical protein
MDNPNLLYEAARNTAHGCAMLSIESTRAQVPTGSSLAFMSSTPCTGAFPSKEKELVGKHPQCSGQAFAQTAKQNVGEKA